METDPNVIGWTPIETPDGKYCSPRCGCGCTKAAYEQAVVDATTLCALLGPNWTPRVWENGGWHYMALIGKVHGREPNIGVHSKNPSTGLHFVTANLTNLPQVCGSYEDPVEGAKEVLGEMLRKATTIQVEITSLLKVAS